MRSIIVPVGLAILLMGQASGQAPQGKSNPCPPGTSAKNGITGEKGSTGYERPSSQPQEKSAILPSAPQNEQSAAPTVQQNGQSVQAETTCERTPNQPR
jgi:hypothetical protein